MFDYIIVGQGLAGTVLAHIFLDQKKKVLILNSPQHKCYSTVAAGIYNPVTGKRIVKTWKADLIFPFLEEFYQAKEQLLGEVFLHKMPVYKAFSTMGELNQLHSEAEYLPDIKLNVPISKYSKYIHNDAGGFETIRSGYLDVKKFLTSSAGYFMRNKILKNIPFDFHDLNMGSSGVEWQGLKSKKIIFCDGSYGNTNPYFCWLPFVLTKGQLLNIHMEQFPEETIINKSLFVLPIGNSRFKCGATYEWSFENDDITPEAAQSLGQKLDGMLKGPYQVVSQEAGIRPTVKDRRPFIGLHPQHPCLGIFNGLGTKGVSLAPYYARHFYMHLEEKKDLDPEVNITRYKSLLND